MALISYIRRQSAPLSLRSHALSLLPILGPPTSSVRLKSSSHSPCSVPVLGPATGSAPLSPRSHTLSLFPVLRPLTSSVPLTSSSHSLCPPPVLGPAIGSATAPLSASFHTLSLLPVLRPLTCSAFLSSSSHSLCPVPVLGPATGSGCLRHFRTHAWVPSKLSPLTTSAYVIGTSDASENNSSGGAVSWILRDRKLDVIKKGGWWFSGTEYATNSDLMKLLGIKTLIISIPEKFNTTIVEIYSDKSKPIELIEQVNHFFEAGLSWAGIQAALTKVHPLDENLTPEMLHVVYEICNLMKRFDPGSKILKIARVDNMLADGAARYYNGYVTDKELYLGNKIITGAIVL